jgi:hypothetical protein
MAKSNFIVRGGADFSGIKTEMDKTQKQFKGFQSAFSTGLKTLGKLAGITLGAKALVDFGKAAIKVSSDLEEIQNVTDTVFGSMARDVDKFSKTLIESHGIGELSAKKYASYMGAMLKSSGIQGDAVRQMSKDLTLLTADMASFYNLGTEEMFQKLMSGMSGATMPLKQLGINMNIANLEAFAMSQGIRKSWQEMSQAEQVMLRYQYLMAVTGDAQGDFARNNWNWAHSVKILGEKWQEFMGIVGKGLQVVILPLVKGLIKVLDLLIKIATAVEKVFVMITGKKVDVEPRQVGIVDDYAGVMDDLGGFSDDAAKGQKDLGKGIKDAAKAAKGALAPFDELNILQQSLADAGAGVGKSPLDGINFNNNFKVDPVGDSLADGFKKAQKEGNKFFIWFGDKWNGLKELVAIPITVAAPVFPIIPSPVYNPNWGLDVPPIPVPLFPPIPVPVYNPVWNLVPPPVPAVDYSQYANSLEAMKIKTAEIFEGIKVNTENAVDAIKVSVVSNYEKMKQGALEHTEKLRQGQAELWGQIKAETATAIGEINMGLSTAWSAIEANYGVHKAIVTALTTGLLLGLETSATATMERMNTNISTVLETIETNYGIHKENVATLATGIATALATNINEGLSTAAKNVNTTIGAMQTSLQSFGRNATSVAAETAKGFANNLSEGFKTASQNFAAFANGVGQSLSAFGSGFLRASAETAKGFVDNMVSGFATVWSNFINLMSGLGEKISGFFHENRSVITKVAIGAGIAVGAGALALAVPAAIPYVASALGGLAAVPALAKGGITDGPMLAMVGDNPGGKEVISPLETLQDMLISAVGTAMMETSQFSNGNSQPIIVKTYLDGREVARAIYDPLGEEIGRRGDPVIQPL